MKLLVSAVMLVLLYKESESQLPFNFGNPADECRCDPGALYNCPRMPVRRCEEVRRPCGCCPECALTRGAKCDSLSPPCGRNLLCVHNNGTIAKKYLRWNEFDFHGTCRRLELEDCFCYDIHKHVLCTQKQFRFA